MTRVAYVGNFGPEYSTENDVRRAFESMEVDVTCMQEDKVRLDTLSEIAHESDLLLWTSTWDDAFTLADARTLAHDLAKKGIPSATYHLDTFWVTSRGGRRWWLNPMFGMGHVFTADGDHERKWVDMGVRHHWLRPGVRHDAVHVGEFKDEHACDVAFVGSNGRGYHEDVWTYRRDLVDHLRAMCDRNGWSWRNPGGEPEREDYGKVSRGEPMNEFYASAKVTVGDSLCPQRERSRYWSDRAYEAPGRGGFLIMPQIDALLKDYDDSLVMYPWGDWGKLEELIDWWLSNDAARKDLVEKNLETVRQRHTYVHRMTELLETVLP